LRKQIPFHAITFILKPPNGLAHLPPDLARQENLKTTFSTNWPPHTRAEGGQVEPVLASLAIACS